MTRPVKIIIAEDSLIWRKTIIRELEPTDIKVIGEADTGKELIRQLATKKPDLVVMDLEMPEMDGNTAFNYLKRNYPELKVIILSQYDDISLLENYRERGAFAFLSKQQVSAGFDLLINTINSAVLSGSENTSKRKQKLSSFNKKEIQIIPLICEGKTSKEIAEIVGTSEKTIERLRQNVFKKSNSRNVAEFVRKSIKKGLEFLGK